MKKLVVISLSFFLVFLNAGCTSTFDDTTYLKETRKFSELQKAFTKSHFLENKLGFEEDIDIIHEYFYDHDQSYKKAYDQAKKIDKYNVEQAPSAVKDFHKTLKNPFQFSMKFTLYKNYESPKLFLSFSTKEQTFINTHILQVSKERKAYREYLKEHGNPKLYLFS